MNTQQTTLPAPIGADGYLTFALSNVLLLSTFGIFWLREVHHVYRVAKSAQIQVPHRDTILVFGLRLENNCASKDFVKRLDRAVKLYRSGVASRIVVLGGITGKNTVSEAECGKNYLVDKQNIPAKAIYLEDSSRHTLENLFNARKGLLEVRKDQCILISNRYHLARSQVIADGLKVNHLICPAEDNFKHSRNNIKRILLEGYLIHWYKVGRAWARLTKNNKTLDRIT